MAGESQEAVRFLTVPFDYHLSGAAADELALLCIPTGKNMQVEVLSVGFTGRDVGSAALTARVEWRDALTTGAALETVADSFVPTNVTPDRVLDCDSTTLAEIADVLGTLIADLQIGLPLPAYTITNLSRALTYNHSADTNALLADQVGQLIQDLNDSRIVNVVFSSSPSADRVFDANSTTLAEMAAVLETLHVELTPTAYLHAAANLVNQGIEGYVSLWDGSQVLDQGDALNLEITNSAGTDKEGYAAIVEYRVLRRS